MATRLATNTWAPNKASCEPPTKAWIMPTSTLIRVMIGRASAPDCCTASQKSRRRISARPRRSRQKASVPSPTKLAMSAAAATNAVAPAPSRVSRPPGGGSRRSRRSGTAAARRINRTAPSGRSPGCSSRPCACASSAACIKKLGRSESQSPRAAASTRSLAPGRAARRAARISASRGGPFSITQSPASRRTSSAPWSTIVAIGARLSPPVRPGSETAAIAPTIRAGACLHDPPLVTPVSAKHFTGLAIPRVVCALCHPAACAPCGVHFMRRFTWMGCANAVAGSLRRRADGNEPDGAGRARSRGGACGGRADPAGVPAHHQGQRNDCGDGRDRRAELGHLWADPGRRRRRPAPDGQCRPGEQGKVRIMLAQAGGGTSLAVFADFAAEYRNPYTGTGLERACRTTGTLERVLLDAAAG